jgi:hypothetical protein
MTWLTFIQKEIVIIASEKTSGYTYYIFNNKNYEEFYVV